MKNIRKVCLALAVALFMGMIIPASVPGAIAAEFDVADGTLTAYNGNAAHVVIPSNVYYIGDNAFRGNTSLQSITFHNKVASIGRRAFQGCTSLTKVVIPSYVTSIPTAAFEECTSLSSVTLHPYLVSVGAEAFNNCPITSLELPYSLKTIGTSAFRNSRLDSVHIPASVSAIGDFAFTKNGSLTITSPAGSRAQSYAETFGHSFVAKTDTPPASVPPLPALDIPPRATKIDESTVLPQYAGPEEAPSTWAIQGVNYIYNNTDIEESYFRSFKIGVTRSEAAYHLVHIYYALTGETFTLYDAITGEAFADTENPYVITARKLGLMNGVNLEKNLFDPETILQRQQMTMMLINLLDSAGVPYNKGSLDSIVFADQSSVASWAAEALKRCYLLGLINGTNSANPPTVSPTNNLDREQLFQMFANLLMSAGKIREQYTRGETLKTPKLLYSGVGKHPEGHIDEAYYSSPAVTDIDSDGRMEIIYTAYSIYCVDAKTGTIEWQVPSGYDRSAPAGTKPAGRSFSDVIVRDIDGDGEPEIVVGHSNMYDASGKQLPSSQYTGVLAVYNKNGYFEPGWPKAMPQIINSVQVYDLDGNGTSEIVIGLSKETSLELVWAFDHKGNVLSGWPQLTNVSSGNVNLDRNDNTGYLYGFQNNTIAIGDIDGSGRAAIVTPTDIRHIAAFDMHGNLLKANPVFGGRSWGRVGTWLDYEYEKLVENEGFGFDNYVWSSALNRMVKIPWEDVPMEKRLGANFMCSPALITDVDDDGINEVVVVGTIGDTAYPYPELPVFEAPFIFNGDRTRFQNEQYDWTSVPTEAGPILLSDYRLMVLNLLAPTVIDLKGDGVKNLLWNSMSGKVMCYGLDKEFSWSFWVNDKDNHTIEFASPLATADLNHDGFQEIVFGTNTPYDSTRTGRLIILDYKGAKLAEVELPKAIASPNRTNGLVSRPVIVDIDGDGKPYIILNTYMSGLTVYKIDY